MASRFQLRRGTSAQWVSFNPVLASGEPGAELDTGRIKVGDGVSTWTSLPYSGATDVNIDMLPSGSVLSVIKSGDTWPSRPTSRADVTVIWYGDNPGPPAVTSGSGGLLTGTDIRIATTSAIDSLPAGTTLTVSKSGSTWPLRPTSRTDIVVAWKGADPSPPIVNSGTAGMINNVDYRIVV